MEECADSGVKRRHDSESKLSEDADVKRCCIESEPIETNLLDLSDDVLLCILQHCHPKDLKSLGFSCERLGNLVRDRSLWCSVDARGRSMGTQQVGWLVTRMLHQHTRELAMTGHSQESQGCLGRFNGKRPINKKRSKSESKPDDSRKSDRDSENATNYPSPRPVQIFIGRRNQHLPRYSASPSWPDTPRQPSPTSQPQCVCEDDSSVLSDESTPQVDEPTKCPGPLFSVNEKILRDLKAACPALTRLSLDYCNINCNTTKLENFPQSLLYLSLRGTRCFNMAMNKSYLFQIQLQLPNLEEIDLSECSWLEAATLLPLSKLTKLQSLLLSNCPRLAECVAYSSLAARYGFKTLKKLDLSGSPMGDSEVSAFGWCVALEELRLAPSGNGGESTRKDPHAHYEDDPPYNVPMQDEWEEEVRTGILCKATSRVHFARFRSAIDVFPKVDNAAPPDRNQLNIEAYDNVIHVSLNRPRPGEPRNPPPDAGAGEANVVHVSVRRSANNPDQNAQLNLEGRVRIRRQRHEEQGDRINIHDLGVMQGGYLHLAMQRPPQVMQRNEDDQNENDPNENEPGPSNVNREDKSCQSDPLLPASDETTPNMKDVSTNTSNSEASTSSICDVEGESSNIRIKDRFNSTTNETDGENSNANNKQTPADKSNRPKIRKEFGCSPSTSCETNKPSTSKDDSPNKSEPGSSTSLFLDDSSSSTDDDGPSVAKKRRVQAVSDENQHNCECEAHGFVNLEVVIRNDRIMVGQNDNDDNVNRNDDNENRVDNNENRNDNNADDVNRNENDPRVHVIYVNARPQGQDDQQNENEGDNERRMRNILHQRPQFDQDRGLFVHVMQLPFIENILYRPSVSSHLDGSSLISDTAIHRFGYSDDAQGNYVHIGPNGVVRVGANPAVSDRPNKSKLKVLVLRGFTGITNRSLVHLATAAPDLRYLDVRGTKVTKKGVENFKSIRPDCELIADF